MKAEKEKLIISASQAGRLLGVKADTVRYRMETGAWKIGEVLPAKGKNGKKRYLVYLPLFKRKFGIEG